MSIRLQLIPLFNLRMDYFCIREFLLSVDCLLQNEWHHCCLVTDDVTHCAKLSSALKAIPLYLWTLTSYFNFVRQYSYTEPVLGISLERYHSCFVKLVQSQFKRVSSAFGLSNVLSFSFSQRQKIHWKDVSAAWRKLLHNVSFASRWEEPRVTEQIQGLSKRFEQ
jgi:hypothetical protein